MSREVSVLFRATDNYSTALDAMKLKTRDFHSDLGGLQSKLDALNRTRANLKVETDDARRQLKEAKRAFEELGTEQARMNFEEANQAFSNMQDNLRAVTSEINGTQKAMRSLADENRRAANGGGGGGLLAGLGKAGFGQLAAKAGQEIANTAMGSMLGDSGGSLFGSALSGTLTGAAMGSIIPGLGTAVGAAIGGAIGLAQGGAQIFEKKDSAFQSYVQEAVQGQLESRQAGMTAGSATAGSREARQLAFSTLLGSDAAAADFMGRVQEMAVRTNYTYDEITGYAKSLIKPFGADRSLEVLTNLSDASAALSLDQSDNSVLIAGLSRMRLTDKTTQEYLNYFSERGIDVYEALSKWGDAAAVAEKVTRGQIRGTEASDAILAYMEEQYGGLSERMAGTYEGLMDNLADAETEVEAAYGRGYNERRKQGLREQMDWLGGASGDLVSQANEAIGAFYAEQENAKEEMVRSAMDAVMASDDYRKAQAEGNAAEMGRMLMEAKIRAQSEYNASEGAQLILQSELDLAQMVRENTAADSAFWDAGYQRGQAYSKGIVDGRLRAAGWWSTEESYGKTISGAVGGMNSAAGWYAAQRPAGHAYGLERVPYDNYPALLHEGERVKTAAQARAEDRTGGSVQVVVNGLTVREDADVERIAQVFLDKLRLARAVG